MDNLRFAYLGDAVYELYIRKYLIDKLDIKKVKDLQETAIKYVSAKSQVRISKAIQNLKSLFQKKKSS